MDGEVIPQATGEARALAAGVGRAPARSHNRAGAPRARARRMLSASQLIVVLAVLAMGATLLAGAIGYGLARQSDERLWARAARLAAQRRRRIPHAVRQIRGRSIRASCAWSSRAPACKASNSKPIRPPSEREMQPVMDAQGRIAGFLTWEKTHPMMQAMHRLMPFIVGIAIVLVGLRRIFAMPARAARGANWRRAKRQARRAADEDKLTGLPNHAKTLELLDLALAERAGDDVTTFALIELDGMADVNAQLGVLGGDELIVAVAERLQEALPDERVLRPHRQRRVCRDLHGRRRRRCRRHHPRRARRDRAPALDRHRGAHQRACRLRAGAAPRRPRAAN